MIKELITESSIIV